MDYIIIGASTGLGKKLAYQFAKNKKNLILSSRDLDELNLIKYDIEKKFQIKVQTIQADFSKIENVKKKFNLKKNFFKNVEGILFPIGQMDDLDQINTNSKTINSLMLSNFISVSYLATKFIKEKKEGIVVGFGSVSGALGRKINPYYSASKRGLESFFESLILSNKNKKILIHFYILGYLDTNLSFGKKLFLKKGSTQLLSKEVYRNRLKSSGKYYFPYWWNIIVFILKLLPFNFLIFFFNFLNR